MCSSEIPAYRRWRQENREFKDSLSYIVFSLLFETLSQKNKTKKEKLNTHTYTLSLPGEDLCRKNLKPQTQDSICIFPLNHRLGKKKKNTKTTSLFYVRKHRVWWGVVLKAYILEYLSLDGSSEELRTLIKLEILRVCMWHLLYKV